MASSPLYFSKILISGIHCIACVVSIPSISCALRIWSEAAASPRLFVLVCYEPITTHYIPQMLTVRSIHFVIMKAPNMSSVICPEIITISVAKSLLTRKRYLDWFCRLVLSQMIESTLSSVGKRPGYFLANAFSRQAFSFPQKLWLPQRRPLIPILN